MKKNVDFVSIWLILVVALILVMVCLGGITRITGSGLSITEWKPIMGAIPPLSEQDWLEAFSKYKLIPQYKIINSGMSLSEFKNIFFWEYFHRLLGRLLGFLVFFPGLFFVVKKKVNLRFTRKILLGLFLGLLQGFLGWYMVSSGLTELVYVSHLRLAAHLMLALMILYYWSDLYFQWKNQFVSFEIERHSPRLRISMMANSILFFVQLLYGALVAGLKAGYSFNTFPKMNGEWLPSNFFHMTPAWINFFNNSASTQFMHRWIPVGLVVFVISTLIFSKKENGSRVFLRSGLIFLAILLAQFLLGVLTIIFKVPIVIAVLHQLNACIAVIVFSNWTFHYRRKYICR